MRLTFGGRKMEYRILSAAICLFLTFAEVMSDDCPERYQRFSTDHSYCKARNPSCAIQQYGLHQQERDQIVQLHNQYRSVIATRQKGSNGLPGAADMLYMEWDNELAWIAQRHADQCIFEHDEDEQRRVNNFGVGQNIAEMKDTGTNIQRPKSDWNKAVAMWYNEIQNFTSTSLICGSREYPPGVIGHFTQVVWSKSFRIGCGYTMYKKGNSYIRLYVCNYGPEGNTESKCVYKQGAACSQCPINTKCSEESQYPGLCKRINNDAAPYLPVKVPHIFNCNFANSSSPDCKIYGESTWHYVSALSGNYLETILQPGQNGTVVFDKSIISSSSASKMCFHIRFRKGPTLAKNRQYNLGKAQFFVQKIDWIADYKFPDYDGGQRHQFTQYGANLLWTDPTKLKITFAVPRGATPQFLNIASVVGFNNDCPKIDY